MSVMMKPLFYLAAQGKMSDLIGCLDNGLGNKAIVNQVFNLTLWNRSCP